jgi:uncharacterized protein YcbK (DUF882 family)
MTVRGGAPTAARRSRRLPRANGATVALFAFAALGIVQFYRPPEGLARSSRLYAATDLSAAAPSLDAFGTSGEVRVRFALPGEAVEFPLEVTGDPAALRYAWIRTTDTIFVDSARALAGANVTVPAQPGFYRLALVTDSTRRILDEPTVAVMVPFTRKVGGWLNGYRIGTYVSERLGTPRDRPEGFLEVTEAQLDLQVSRHFRLADFVTHDTQDDVWPKYVALDPRLLDKLELVLAKIRESNEAAARVDLAPDVHSGFRTPAHNAGVLRAARDSRHQYGDAADVAIDADGDGRVTWRDETLIARAVDAVEDEHPELAGGLGLYTSRRYRTPYVHIDARGRRSRWRG